MIYSQIIGICWLAFLLSWVILAASFGRRARKQYFSVGGLGLRLLIGISLAYAAVHTSPDWLEASTGSALAPAGAAICIVGLAFAIWARVALGANWGMPRTVHENPDLVTSGPYRYVRHPIYTGLATMFIGTALVAPFAAIPGAAFIAYIVFSARREEQDMQRRFPDTYPEYRKRSKFLVPFLL